MCDDDTWFSHLLIELAMLIDILIVEGNNDVENNREVYLVHSTISLNICFINIYRHPLSLRGWRLFNNATGSMTLKNAHVLSQ